MESDRKQAEQEKNQSQKPRTPRLATDLSDPEIDLKQGAEDNRQLEQSNPKFKLMVDKLRKAAKAVGREMKMFLLLAMTVAEKHR